LVMPVLLTTSLMISSLIKTASSSRVGALPRYRQLHDRIEFIVMSREGAQSRMAPVSSADFRRACGRFATGIAVASVLDAEGAPQGLTVSSFTSVSLEPPLILICLGHAVTNLEDFRRACYFGISILRESDRDLSARFAQKGGVRFDGIGWLPGETGVPLLAGALAALECAVYQRFPSGDHDILVGEVVRICANDGAPLIHFAGRYRNLAPEVA